MKLPFVSAGATPKLQGSPNRPSSHHPPLDPPCPSVPFFLLSYYVLNLTALSSSLSWAYFVAG